MSYISLKRLLISIFITVFMLSFSKPNPLLAQEEPACDETYTVQAGDWLSKIAVKYYGDPLAYDRLVMAANVNPDDAYTNIKNPDLIEPGWAICIVSSDMMTVPEDVAVSAPAGLTPEELANATYQSQYTASGTATLQDGMYSEAAAPGSATQTRVTMTPNLAYGTLNGQQAAAVILVTDLGGSGTFYDLHVMVAPDGQPTNPVAAFLGDRIEINSLTIENNRIVVDMVQAGPDDPFCCPTQQVVKAFEWQGDQLVEVASEEVAQSQSQPEAAASPLDSMEHTPDPNLIDKSWAWERRDPNGNQIEEISVSNPENYLLTFSADGTFVAKVDCNNVLGQYASSSPAETINSIFMEAGSTTMVFCGEDSLDVQMSQMFGPAQNYQFEEDGAVLKFIWVAAGPIDYYRYRSDIGELIWKPK
jgi:LysM repeat protein/heat shock protein HslJ